MWSCGQRSLPLHFQTKISASNRNTPGNASPLQVRICRHIAVLKLMRGTTGEASQYENPRFTAKMVKGDAVAPTFLEPDRSLQLFEKRYIYVRSRSRP
ncbi:MAG: hypothetical protein F6J93_12145 [Oscillatoria sp. SIO1A7]|nr:hypothetical protein [Oscillatoria sp. SIO1A7]